MPDNVKPMDVVDAAAAAGAIKAKLPTLHLLTRGMYSGFILGCAMTMAATVATQVGVPAAGAVVFPGGFILVVLLGLELVTGNFALLPMSVLAQRATVPELLRNWAAVWTFNFIGALLYAGCITAALTQFGAIPDGGAVGRYLIQAATGKVVPYVNAGLVKGMATCLLKAILCNWLVCVATVCGLSSSSTLGKIAACWFPVFMFFIQGFEHAVLNMFLLPAAILLGAPDLTVDNILIWNILPVTLGNMIGAMSFVALPLWLTWGHSYRNWHYEVVIGQPSPSSTAAGDKAPPSPLSLSTPLTGRDGPNQLTFNNV